MTARRDSTENDSAENLSITTGRNAWVRYASEVAGRWVALKGAPPADMQKFGKDLREQRYRTRLNLNDIASDLRLPYEQLAMLEQGLLRPSEVPSPAWVRFMRLLEGREQMAPPVTEQQAAPEPTPTDPDEAWAIEGEFDISLPEARPVRESGTMQSLGAARIKVFGIGGGGSNAVSRMYQQGVIGVEYLAINTDAQHLLRMDIPQKLRIGDRLTRGLGVGGNPETGREAAEESREDLLDLIEGTDMLFIAAGMGGGTGTGAAPVIAELAKELGILTIAVVTKPFAFEGATRMAQANKGVAEIQGNVDTLILIPNDRLSAIADERMTTENAFRIADDVLRQGVQSIAELVTVPGEINLDFADVKAVMAGGGPAWMAIGSGRGEGRALAAARAAIASPLLDAPIEGATRVLLNVTGGADLTLREVQEAADFISEAVDPEANIIFGMVTDPKMDDEVRMTIIATGLPVGSDAFSSDALADMLEGPGREVEHEADSSVELPPFLRRFRRRNDG